MKSHRTTMATGSYDEHVRNVKAMFYLLTPNETFYEKTEDVPDFTKKVIVMLSSFKTNLA